LSVQIADIEHKEETIIVPAIIASVVREVIKEKAPSPPHSIKHTLLQDEILTPFVCEPMLSGSDSSENQTVISRAHNNIRVKCDTILLPLSEPVPVRIYLTGREIDLPIDGQRCTVDVFCGEGYAKRLGVTRRDSEGHIYIEVQERGKIWECGSEPEGTRFHIDTLFSVK
jgi:hypothetical protein